MVIHFFHRVFIGACLLFVFGSPTVLLANENSGGIAITATDLTKTLLLEQNISAGKAYCLEYLLASSLSHATVTLDAEFIGSNKKVIDKQEVKKVFWQFGENTQKLNLFAPEGAIGIRLYGYISSSSAGAQGAANLKLIKLFEQPYVKIVSTGNDLVFRPNKPINLQLEAKGLISTNSISLKWTISDLWGNTVEKSGALPFPATLTLPGLNEGYYRLSLELNIQGYPPALTEKNITVLRSLNNNVTDNRFALDAGLSWEFNNADEAERALKLAKELGVTSIRDRLSWNQVDNNGKFDFSRYQKSIQLANKTGLKIGTVFHDTAKYFRKDLGQSFPALMADGIPTKDLFSVYRFTQSTAALSPSLDFIEIWNEQNSSFFLGRADEYAALLKAAYWGIKDEKKSTQVLIGSASGPPGIFFNEISYNNTAPFFDIYNQHFYGMGNEALNFFSEINNFSNKAGWGDKPVWVTESGMSVKPDSNGLFTQPEIDQAIHVWKTLSSALTVGINRFYLFYLKELFEDNTHLWGILYSDLTPKPAYFSYALLIRELNQAKSIGMITQDNLAGSVFQKPDGSYVYVVWSKKGTTTTASKTPVITIDIGGKRTSVPLDTPLTFTERPLILLGQPGTQSSVFQYKPIEKTATNSSNKPSRFVVSLAKKNDKRWGQNQAIWRREKDFGIAISEQDNKLVVSINNFSKQRSEVALHCFTSEANVVVNKPYQALVVDALSSSSTEIELNLGKKHSARLTCEAKQGDNLDFVNVPIIDDISIQANKSDNSVELLAGQHLLEVVTPHNAKNLTTAITANTSGFLNKKISLKINSNVLSRGEVWIFPEFKFDQTTDLQNYDGLEFEVVLPTNAHKPPVPLLLQLMEQDGGIWLVDLLPSTKGEITILRGSFVTARQAPWKPDPDGQLDLHKVRSILFGWGGYTGIAGESHEFELFSIRGIKSQ